MKIQSRSFILPNPVTFLTPNPAVMRIRYYTDSVFNPLIFEIKHKIEQIESTTQNQQQSTSLKQHRVYMDFSFLIEATREHPKILDNIGIINIWFKKQQNSNKNHNQQALPKLGDEAGGTVVQRFGVLVTNQNGDLYVSLIQ